MAASRAIASQIAAFLQSRSSEIRRRNFLRQNDRLAGQTADGPLWLPEFSHLVNAKDIFTQRFTGSL